jgi:hypothetical protein
MIGSWLSRNGGLPSETASLVGLAGAFIAFWLIIVGFFVEFFRD